MSPAIDAAARFYSEGNWTEAARVCLGILESDPAQCDALHLLGVVCAHLGQSADAVGYLTRAAALQPENPKILANLGNAFGGARRFDQAAAAYQRALALHLREAGTLNNLGLALLARISATTGGQELSGSAPVTAPAITPAGDARALWPWLLLAAALLWPLEIAVRRGWLRWRT